MSKTKILSVRLSDATYTAFKLECTIRALDPALILEALISYWIPDSPKQAHLAPHEIKSAFRRERESWQLGDFDEEKNNPLPDIRA